MAEYYVRIKPYNPKKGYVLQRYVTSGHRFHVERGWYRITSTALAKKLKNLPSKIGNEMEEGPRGFDVCTREQAIVIDRREKNLDLHVIRPDDRRPRSPEQAQPAKETPENPVPVVEPEEPEKPLDPDPDGEEVGADDPEPGGGVDPSKSEDDPFDEE